MRTLADLHAIRDTDEVMAEAQKLSPAEQAEFRRRFALILPKMLPDSILRSRQVEIGPTRSPFPEERDEKS